MTINRNLADLAQSLAGGIDIADGGTGATTASAARTALSAQTESATLTALSSVMSSTATAAAQRAALGLDTGNTPDFTGITIGGNADVLDYYDEGTFSPLLKVGGVDKTTFVSLASYIRIGNYVFIQLIIQGNRGTDTGGITITGLPFTSASANGAWTLLAYDNIDPYNGGLLAGFKMGDGATIVYGYSQPNSGTWGLSGLDGSTFMRANNAGFINLSGFYKVA